MRKIKVILCGGGTAGHVSPAIAIADEIKKRHKSCEFLFIGREGGRENEAVTRAKIPLTTLKIKGFIRGLSKENIERVSLIIRAGKESKKILTAFSPDIVIGTGGYVCWPVLRAAQAMHIPTVIHESNAVAGLTTKMLARKCSVVLLGNEEAKKDLDQRANCIMVGNPIKKDFFSISRSDSRKKLKLASDEIMIVSFGGSIGAEKINETVFALMDNYSSKNQKIRHIHAVGERYFEKIKGSRFTTEDNGCMILPYINDMATMLRASDIVICRCGAMTLAEISAVGATAILIPSPNVTNDHQYRNARSLAEKNAAILLEERELTPKVLESIVSILAESKDQRLKYSKCIEKFAIPNATSLIADEIFKILKA